LQSELRRCTEPEQNPYIRIIRHYGHKNQIVKAIEEMSELTKELSKHALGIGRKVRIIEEIADVENCLEQMKLMFDDKGDVPFIRASKVRRTIERMESGD
jgi:uncharacterized protein Yka (UPF0111/DUF47 family)